MGHLQLQHLLVGVSHECDVAPEKGDLDSLISSGSCVRLTSSDINPMVMSQEEARPSFLTRTVSGGEAKIGLVYSVDIP